MSSTTENTNTRNINLHITGFGPFLDVVKNPSSTIMNLVAEYFKSKKQEDAQTTTTVHVSSTNELETSVQAVEKYIGNMMMTLDQEKSSSETATRRTINFFLHFGINRSSKKTIAIETEAENCVLLPPNDLSKFPEYYCADISSPCSGDDDEKEKDKEAKSSRTNPTTSSETTFGKFTADSVSDEQQDQSPPPPPLSSSLKNKVSVLIPTKLRRIANDLLHSSSTLSAPIQNVTLYTSAAQKSNETADDDKTLIVPETYNLATSLDAGKYLCNFIFYMSLLKLSSVQNVRLGFREFNIRSARQEVTDYFFELKNRTPNFLKSFGKSSTTTTSEKDNNTDNIVEKHSLFIHVLDPTRVTEQDQAQIICVFLEKLFEKL